MHTVTVRAAGVTTFWSPHAVGLSGFNEALSRAGVPHSHQARARTDEAALETALMAYGKSIYKPPHVPVVSARKNRKDGFDVFKVLKAQRNTVSVDFGACMKDGKVKYDHGLRAESWPQERLQEEFSRAKAILPGAAVTGVLSRIAVDLHGGWLMRKTGGIYWIPTAYQESWEKVSNEIEKEGAAEVAVAVLEANASTVRAVRQRIISETKERVEFLVEELQAEGKKEGYYKRRVSHLDEIQRTMEGLESELDMSLNETKLAVADAQSAAMVAMMAAQI